MSRARLIEAIRKYPEVVVDLVLAEMCPSGFWMEEIENCAMKTRRSRDDCLLCRALGIEKAGKGGEHGVSSSKSEAPNRNGRQ